MGCGVKYAPLSPSVASRFAASAFSDVHDGGKALLGLPLPSAFTCVSVGGATEVAAPSATLDVVNLGGV